MSFTELTLEAERLALLNDESKADLINWLTSPSMGLQQPDWDEKE